MVTRAAGFLMLPVTRLVLWDRTIGPSPKVPALSANTSGVTSEPPGATGAGGKEPAKVVSILKVTTTGNCI